MNKKIVLSYLISIVLIAGILSVIDLRKVAEGIISAGLINFILLCVLYSFGFVLRAARWKKILLPLTDISLKDSFFITNTGFFVNLILPARAGEIARSYILAKKKGLGKIKSFSTVILDRIIDGITLFLFFFVALIAINIPSQFETIIVLPALVFGFGFLFFVWPDKFSFLGKAVVFIVPSIEGKAKYVFQEVKEAGNIFRAEKKHFFIIIFYSVLLWLVESLVFYFAGIFIGAQLSIFQVFLLIVVAGFAVMIPSAPNYIGTFEAAFVVFFIAFGLNSSTAVSMAVLIHIVQTIVIAVLGFVSLNKMKLSLKSISSADFNEIKNKLKGNS